MVTYKKVTSNSELYEILNLQAKNLRKNLSEKERKEQGFVTVKHSF
jgi:hypothetical protein